MGFSIAWIGFRVAEAPAVLRELNLHVTTKLDPDMDQAPQSYGDMPGGWSILFSNDIEWASEDRVQHLSLHRDVILVIVEEHTDYWGTVYYSNGAPLWRVYRDTSQDDKLHVEGQLPAQYARFVDADAQRAWSDGWAHFNPSRGLPVAEAIQIAEAITGFRHDKSNYTWGEPQFHVVEPGFSSQTGNDSDQSI